jgi:hypothetical protein
MSANQDTSNPQPNANPQGIQPIKKVRDLPGCIKYIILLFLLLLLFGEFYAGEFRGFPDVSRSVFAILFLKLLLILLLIILIWVQRRLFCELTEPTGCANEVIDPNTGNPRLTVKGTASGTVFGHYTLSLQGHPECPVTYPPGGGSVPVVNGVLGWIDTSPVSPGAYTVELTVFPAGAGTPCIKRSSINIVRAAVWLDKVGQIKVQDIGQHPTDSTERLRVLKVNSIDPKETAIGGSVSVEGGAYLEGCGKRMFEYALDHLAAPYGAADPGSPPPQADAAGGWTNILTLAYDDVPQHPYTWSCGFLIGIPNYITNGILTRKWDIGNCSLPPHPLYQTNSGNNWNTGPLNGRYTLRVHEKHKPLGMPAPVENLYEAATMWVDNRTIIAKIRRFRLSGGAGLDVCGELMLSQFLPAMGKVDILGHAWDPLIVDPPAAPVGHRPNDNFGGYRLQFKKDGGALKDIVISAPPYVPPPPSPVLVNPRPVPNVRQVAAPPADDLTNADVLTVWDIVKALDAGPMPPAPAPDPGEKIYRGQRCAYIVYLSVWDETHVSDDGGHADNDQFPFCIVNDLQNEPFPWP